MNTVNEYTQQEQAHSKEYTIVVNGRQKVVSTKELSFAEVVSLAFDNPPTGEFYVFTVTYQRGEGNKPEGSMVEGDVVKVKDGMIFNVTATNRS